MKIIGVAGYARAGKDTFCALANNILKTNGFRVGQYSFAKQLRLEVDPFLRNNCGVSAFTQNPYEKVDIRDFLVWYGTTWWRKRDPKRWIRAVDLQLKSDGNNVDVALVSDVRYPEEAEWTHSWGGYIVHVSTYKMCPRIPTSSFDDGPSSDEPLIRSFFDAPNEQERINDPLVKAQSDYKLEWEFKGLSLEEAVRNKELQVEVLKALNSCSWFTDVMFL